MQSLLTKLNHLRVGTYHPYRTTFNGKLLVCLLSMLLAGSLKSYSQADITRIEYFINTDPGLGNGVPVSFLPNASISNLSIPLNTSGLPKGLNLFHVRARDANGNWSLTQRLLFIIPYAVTGASPRPNITAAEWYIDSDPGTGNGQNIAITPGTDISNLPIPIDPSPLTSGLHAFYIRVKDANGSWSLVNRLLFVKPYNVTGAGPLPDINYMEWFVDNDPGLGKASNISVTPGAIITDKPLNIDIDTLSRGLHSIYLRARDSKGSWSLVNRLLFIKPYTVTGSATRPKISYLEWYLDKDPGIGKANSVTLTSDTALNNVAINVDTTGLTRGIHSFYVRARDVNGSWSLVNRWLLIKSFAVADTLPAPGLTSLEYYIDKDPGTGKGTPVNFSPTTQISSLVISVKIDTLQLGQHKLHIRAKDASGKWSLVNTADFQVDASTATFITVGTIIDSTCAGDSLFIPFTVNKPFEAANIFTAQLSDKNGSFASPVVIGTNTGNQSGTIRSLIPANSLQGFNYRIRIISSSPIDTAFSDHALVVLRAPVTLPIITGDNSVCLGTETYSPANIEPGNNYIWQLSGGGTLDTSAGIATVKWITAGTHTLSLRASNACGISPVRILQITVSNNAPAVAPVITASGRLLSASALPAGSLAYQWFRNDTLIPAAIASTYTAAIAGNYTVKYTNICGTSPASNTISFAAALQNQSINFPALSNKLFGDPAFKLIATASSNLPVSFTASGPAVIAGDSLTITGAGNVVVRANQAGDASFNPAPVVQRSFTVSKAIQSVTFDSIVPPSEGQTSLMLFASSSSGLPINFLIQSGHATITGNQLTVTGAGIITVRALQGGNQNYLSASADQTICIAATQPGTIQGFTEACPGSLVYKIAAVPGTTYTWSLQSGGNLSSITGSSVTVNWTSVGSHLLSVKATSGCANDTGLSRSLAVTITNTLVPSAPSNLFPANATVITSFPFAVSWQPSVNASVYDVYTWPDGASIPTVPLIKDITQIGTLIQQYNLPGFAAGKTYRWKVIARNACAQTSSAVQTFTVSELPNLAVQKLQAPVSIFSGQTIDVTFEIKNTGEAGSGPSTWFDAVYLSADTILNKVIDEYLGSKSNISALNPGQSYTNTIRGILPEDITGNQYLLVQTDVYNSLGEKTDTDNIKAIPLVITLTPPADLQVTSVIAPGDVFSGENITIQYAVKNEGTGDTKTGRWNDVIYLSADSIFDIASAIRMQTVSYNAAVLKADSAYTRSITLTVPDKSFGTYYFYVVTDADKKIYEFAFENNNTGKSNPVTIYLTPPPDFVVTELNNPAIASPGESILIDWAVQNQGATAPRSNNKNWIDAVYISKDSVYNNKAIQLTSKAPLPYPLFVPGETYFNSVTAVVPGNFKDTCYIYVVADKTNNVFEYLNENNNSKRSIIVIKTADLIVSVITAPANASSGNDLSLEWTVKNQGTGKIPSRSRTDVIWLSATSVFNSSAAINMGSVMYDNPMDPGASLSKEKTIRLPNSISGIYYLFVETDRNNNIYEGDFESNNRLISQPIQIALSPWADLKVLSVTVDKDTIISEKKVAIAYKITNSGTSDISGAAWKDNIYISGDSVWPTGRYTLIKSIDRTQLLAVNDSYEVSDSLYISMNLLRSVGVNNSNLYFYVVTDAGQSIYENGSETNNTGRSNKVPARHAEHSDLVMTRVSLPDSLASGRPATVEWDVINKGGITGYYGDYWYDGIFVSQDTVFSSTDAFITDKVLYGPLNKDEIYNARMTFTVPNGLSGKYYLLMVADHKNYNRDKNFADNYKTITKSAGPGQPQIPQTIDITLTPSADLTVTSFEHPAIGYAGQPIMVKWKVMNLGPATAKNGWTERVYLSTDNKIDGSDKALESYARKGSLDSNAFYQDSMEVFLPREAAGNYYILFRTDNNDIIYEHQSENNNTAVGTLFIIQADPSDLIVSNVSTKATASIGDTITVSWTVKNTGVNPAQGRLKEGIYFSLDTIWSNDDLLMSTLDGAVILSPQAETQHSQKVKINGIAAGNYYVIVRTDMGDNIFEQDEKNNTHASGAAIAISVLELPLNVLTSNNLTNNQELYYRLIIPDSLAGETILVTLKGDSLKGANELYIRHGNIPTRANYDFAHSKALSAQQEIVLPSVVAGSYYILVYGATTNGTQQPISLLAKKINFEILNVTSNQGGNTGSVTIKISGAKFEPGMQVRLSDAQLGTMTAHTVTFISSTTIFASFNLAGAATGTYDVKLKKINSDSTSLRDGFTIVQGSGGGVAGGGNPGTGFYCTVTNIGVEQLLAVDVQYPEATRTRRVFPMVINFGNSSNVDIPVPTRIMISLGGDPISLTAEGIAENKKELYIKFKELNGPPDVLRPGATGSVTIFTLSNTGANLRFRLIE